jgi:cation:H+ antiporter
MACVGLVLGSHLVVKALVKIDAYYRLREFIVGSLLMGCLTSLPEFFVGIFSALTNVSSLSLGNILGSNIVDIALIGGIVAIIGKNVKFETGIEKRTIFIITAMTLLPLVLFLDQELSRIDGIILIAVFFLYVIRILTMKKNFKVAKYGKVTKRELHKDIIIFIVSLAILLGSTRLMVYAAANIAIGLLVPPMLIGLVIVSVCTSLPELFFEASSVSKGCNSMAIGDLLGSLAFNSTFILGVQALILPFNIPFDFSFSVTSIFVIVSILMYLIFARSGKKMSRKEGFILIFVYILFIVTSIFLARK